MRIIPKTAKVKIEFFKNISVVDVIIALVALALEVLLFTTNIPPIPKFATMVLLLAFTVWLYMPFDGQRFYMMFVNLAKYVFSVKKYSKEYNKANAGIDNFIAFKDIKDGFIVYNEYYAGVLEIDPREFRLLSGYKQDQIIDVHFGKVIRSISGNTKASIVKIDRKMMLDKYIEAEREKERQLEILFEAGSIDENEKFVRQKIIADRISIYKRLSEETVLRKPFYYLVVYDKDKGVIRDILTNGISNFIDAGMSSRMLDDRGLALFLKYTFTDNFEESDIDMLADEELLAWVKPTEIRFTPKSAVIDGIETFNYSVRNFPLSVLNAWGYQMFNIEDTKVVMNIEPFEKNKAVRMIDRSLIELSSQSENSFKASSLIDKRTHVETLVDVLRMLQNDNETLFSVTLHFTIYNKSGLTSAEAKKNLKKTIKRIVTEQGFELADNFCKQN